MLGVDRLDYTKGIRHRLKAYEELLRDKAITAPEDERRRRRKAMRKRVADHDVQQWAARYLKALASAPLKPHRPTRASAEELRSVEQANRANLRASDRASERMGGWLEPVTPRP